MSVRNRRIILAALIIIGFMAIEIPGIFFVCNRIYPFIFGFPFLYGYVIICWLYMCIILFIGYRTSWGKNSLFIKK